MNYSRKSSYLCHELIIDNYTDNEIINYPIIILKGHIIEQSSDCTCQPELELLNSNQIFPITKSKFKLLVELNLGENVVELKHCCQQLNIKLNYKPRSSEYNVVPLYIICDDHDGKFQAPSSEPNKIENGCERIDTCLKLLQTIFAEKLYEENLGRKSFVIAGKTQIFRSKLKLQEVSKMNQNQLWEELGREILNTADVFHQTQKFLGFLSSTYYRGDDYDESKTHDDLIAITDGYVALGGGGFALIGTPCLYTWPRSVTEVLERFQDQTPIDRKNFLDDSYFRGSWGACFATTLGSALHELCHTFDLGHTDSGIMARGFDNIQDIFIIGKGCNVQKTSIEFKEQFASGLLSEKLNEKPKEYIVKNIQKDEIFWTKSCLMILAHHRWFNNFPNTNFILKYDRENRIISSTKGIRVIELRRDFDGLVLHNWVFEGRVLRYSFQIPEIDGKFDLIISDNVGNILKESY